MPAVCLLGADGDLESKNARRRFPRVHRASVFVNRTRPDELTEKSATFRKRRGFFQFLRKRRDTTNGSERRRLSPISPKRRGGRSRNNDEKNDTVWGGTGKE